MLFKLKNEGKRKQEEVKESRICNFSSDGSSSLCIIKTDSPPSEWHDFPLNNYNNLHSTTELAIIYYNVIN